MALDIFSMQPGITASVVADTLPRCLDAKGSSYHDTRLTTLEVRVPTVIWPQVLTHRMFSRNARSMRAMSFDKLVREVENDPFVPIFRSKQLGMKGGKLLTGDVLAECVGSYLASRDEAVKAAKRLNNCGAHQESVNRLLTPFTWTTAVISATEWENWIKLRMSEDSAQDEVLILATRMLKATLESTPVRRRIHLPFVPLDVWSDDSALDVAMSAARCARVSYSNNRLKDREKDMRLAARLLQNKHMSPFEHCAFPMQNPDMYANFKGWRSARYELEHEKGSLLWHILEMGTR